MSSSSSSGNQISIRPIQSLVQGFGELKVSSATVNPVLQECMNEVQRLGRSYADAFGKYISNAGLVPTLERSPRVKVTGSLPHMLSVGEHLNMGKDHGLFVVSGGRVHYNQDALYDLSNVIRELVKFIDADETRRQVAWRCSMMAGFTPSDVNM